MRESYERYKRSEKHASTAMIDHPIIFLRGFTKTELMAGVFLFIVGIYVSAMSLIFTFIFVGCAYGAPFALRYARLKFPPNIWCHFLWYLGLWNSPLARPYKRPRYRLLSPSGDQR